MNKIFKSVWSDSSKTCIAVSEKSSGYAKNSSHEVACSSATFGSMQKFQKKLVCLAVMSGFSICTSVSHAAILNWDAPVTGNWLDAGNWNSGFVPTSTDNAVINNGGTAVINQGESGSANVVIIGDGTDGGVHVDFDGSLLSMEMIIGNNASGILHINGGEAKTTGANDVNVGQGFGEGMIVVDGGGSFTSTGTLSIGETGKGVLLLNNGTVNVGSFLYAGKLSGSEGSIIVNGGHLITGDSDRNFVVGAEGSGTLEINNDGKVTAEWVFAGGEYRSGFLTYDGGSGKIVINDSGVLESSKGIVTGGMNSTGDVEINGNGKMYTTNSSDIYLGFDGRSNVVVNGGSIHSDGYLEFGVKAPSEGVLTVNAGKVESVNNLIFGLDGTGNVILNGGEITGSKYVYIGANTGGIGTVTMNGGQMNVSEYFYVGRSGTGTFTLNDGVVYNPYSTWVGSAATGVGVMNLNGGVFQTYMIAGSAGSSTVNWNGTKIQALIDSPTFIKQLTTLNVGSQGAVIDSNGFDIGIHSSLTGADDATFTKLGAGTLTMAVTNNAYLGLVEVDQGTVVLGVNGVFDYAGSMTLKNSSILDAQGTVQTLNALSGDSGSSIQMATGQLTLNNDNAKDTVFAGAISGGSVTKTGTGALTLANNSTIDSLSHMQGALNISGGNTVTVNNGNVLISGSNTTLGVGVGSAPAIITTGSANMIGTPTIDLTGYSPATPSGSYTLIQTAGGVYGPINATVGGQALSSFVDLSKYLVGSVYVSGLDLIADVTLVWNNTGVGSAHGTFDITGSNAFTVASPLSDRSGSALGFGWDGQTLTKKGTGILTLDGVNTYTGLSSVQEGTLIVGSHSGLSSAQISGDVDVLSGARLGGHGKILGEVHLYSGATVAPGNSIGTLTVGSITFDSGSHYEFEVDETGQADQIIATNNAIINGGTVDVLANGNIWKTTDIYTLLTAANGVTGTFDGLTTNLAFLQPILTYDANNAYLTFVRNSTGVSDIGETFNQRQTGKGIASLGTGNAIYDRVLSMDAQSARNAFDNLSGEVHASLKSALLTNSRYVRDAVNGHLASSAVVDGDVLDHSRSLWGSSWVHDGYLKDDGNAARTNQNGGGVLIGADLASSEHSAGGVAIGYDHTNLDVGGLRRSDADINAYSLMAYGRTHFGVMDVRGAIGYTWLDVDTTRHITVGGLESVNEASYNGALVQAFVEGSHTFALTPEASFTPYGNIAYTQISTDDFAESGNSTALYNRSHTDRVVTTTLGGRGEWRFGRQGQNVFFADLGWQHHFGDKAAEVRVNFAQGSAFSIRGNELGRDSLLLGLGADFELQQDLNFRVNYQGEFGHQVIDNAIQVQLRWAF